jgi:hypothetical protein
MISHEVLAMGWLPTLPQGFDDALGRYALLAAFAGTAAGTVLWLAGSRFSRSLVTLLAVSLGGVVGLNLPEWLGWQVDAMGVAFAGAMVLGLTGYLLHTTWIGLSLSLVLAVWVGVAAWLTVGGGERLDVPSINWSAQAETIVADLCRNLPGSLPTVMPLAIAGAVAGGVAITVLSPKLGRVLTYTLVGLSMVVVMGVTAMRMSRPDWLAMLPRTFGTQMGILLGLVLTGVLVQWRLTPGGGPSAADDDGSRKE